MDSNIRIETIYSNKKTRIGELHFEAPYKVLPPFYMGEEAEIMILSASAGILKGDKVKLDIICKEDTKTKITSQGYEKIYNTGNGSCEKELNIKVLEDAQLKYLPQPTIFFENSEYRATNVICLHENSSIAFSDIFSVGRVYMGESYKMKSVRNTLSIYVSEKLVTRENMFIDPSKNNYEKLALLESYTHCGMMYLYGKFEKLPIREKINEASMMNSDVEIGITKLNAGTIVRVLANSGEEIFDLFEMVVG